MNNSPQQGRTTQTGNGSSPMRIFYLLLGIIAILGIALIGFFVANNRPQIATTSTPTAASAEPTIPTGFTTDGFAYKGNADAPITVREFSDYQCPGCGFFARTVAQAFEAKYVATGKVQFVYHDYPLNIHPNAIPAAEAARCAGDQNAYWPMHDRLFGNQNQWAALTDTSTQFVAYAQQLGLDQTAFSACIQNHTHQQAVLKARDAGDKLELTGTPSFSVNGTLVDINGVQTVDDIVQRLEAAIDMALAN